MHEQSICEVGNMTVVLMSENDPFSDGHSTGYLEFYDERHRPAFPLTSHAVRDYLLSILRDSSMPEGWRAGRVAGWMEALIENAEETFVSVPLEEHLTVLRSM